MEPLRMAIELLFIIAGTVLIVLIAVEAIDEDTFKNCVVVYLCLHSNVHAVFAHHYEKELKSKVYFAR